ncbi:MAG: hypothetical protein RI894_151 [Bacteroidota bacterium]
MQNATDCATFTPQNTYTYSYDGLNRLIAAASNLGAGTLKAGVGDESYQYDKIGNITSLTRKVIAGNSLETVQQAYSYATGNDSLLGAAFTTTSPRAPFGQTASHTYTYDPNGNLQTDTRRSITQTDYQRANLPNHLVKDGNDIFYEYDINDNRMYKYASASISPLLAGSEYYVRSAAGQDLAIWKLDEQKTTYYVFGSSRLASIETNEDGTLPRAITFYNYDHLGNTRLSYSVVPSCSGAPLYTASAAFDYYPYGKVLREFGASVYLTTSHERDAESGLDYRGARFYDSEVGRFLSLDPLAVKYASLSSYSYVAGNPVAFIDPTGKSAEVVVDEENKTVTIYADMYFYGDEVNDADALNIAAGIQSDWNAANGKIYIKGVAYAVKFQVSGKFISNFQAAIGKSFLGDIFGSPRSNYIEVKEARVGDVSQMDGIASNTGTWYNYNEGKDGLMTKEYSHEFGHLLGWFDKDQLKTKNNDKGQHDYLGTEPGIMTPSNTTHEQAPNMSNAYFDVNGKLDPKTRQVTQRDIDRIAIDTNKLGNSASQNISEKSIKNSTDPKFYTKVSGRNIVNYIDETVPNNSHRP